jgi:outer membrane protein, heavy metal efflux system
VKNLICLFFILILITIKSFSQSAAENVFAKDSVYLSLDQIEVVFVERNFQLLAQKYNIQMADAAIIQSRLYYNPTLTYENVLYNPNTKRALDFTKQNGEVMVQLQQMIFLAGKRSKLVRLAEINKDLEKFAFEDLIRILRFQLTSDYAIIYSDLKKLSVLKLEESKLIQLLEASRERLNVGAISGYELTRIENEIIGLRSAMNDQLREIIDTETELKMMLQMEAKKFIVPTGLFIGDSIVFSYKILMDSALANRPDLKSSYTQLGYQDKNLSLQRAYAIPDIMLGTDYDRFGNAFKNYFGANVSGSLPVFNRNQGNVKIAKVQKELAGKFVSNVSLQVEQDVLAGHDKMIVSTNLSRYLNLAYVESINNILSQAILRYQERVINLLDFIDKVRTFESGQMNLIDIQLNIFLSMHYLNFVTNSNFYK